MALFLFTRAILAGEPIKVFNNGQMQRDFTYIDDIAEGVVRVLDKTASANPAWDGASPDPGTSSAPYRLFNIGNNNPVMLTDFIGAIEKALGKTAQRELLPMQPGDVAATYANIDDLIEAVDYRPQTPVQVGIDNFVAWYGACTRATRECCDDRCGLCRAGVRRLLCGVRRAGDLRDKDARKIKTLQGGGIPFTNRVA